MAQSLVTRSLHARAVLPDLEQALRDALLPLGLQLNLAGEEFLEQLAAEEAASAEGKDAAYEPDVVTYLIEL